MWHHTGLQGHAVATVGIPNWCTGCWVQQAIEVHSAKRASRQIIAGGHACTGLPAAGAGEVVTRKELGRKAQSHNFEPSCFMLFTEALFFCARPYSMWSQMAV